MSLAGKTLFMSGGSRGIGLAIALRAARDGANIVIAAKTADPDPRLEGTIHTAAAAIEAAGGKALPLVVDIRDEERVKAAVAEAVARIRRHRYSHQQRQRHPTDRHARHARQALRPDAWRERRGTFVCAQACLPHLLDAANPHILTLSPPLVTDAKWFRDFPAYTIAKYTMSLFTLALCGRVQGSRCRGQFAMAANRHRDGCRAERNWRCRDACCVSQA